MLQDSYILPYPAFDGTPSHCHLRLYEHNSRQIVVCSETRDNPGTSVTNAAEIIATHIWRELRCPTLEAFIWIERYPADPEAARTSGFDHLEHERFAQVTFIARNTAQGLTLCSPQWSHLCQAKVEELIGETWSAPEV